MVIPDYVVADGNSGVNMKQRNIGMPSGACYAASFNAELVGEVGRVIGEEAMELGISMILGPGFNLQRNPLCGPQSGILLGRSVSGRHAGSSLCQGP